MSFTNKGQIILYWAVTIIASLAFLIPGIGNLAHLPHIAKDMVHLGYPTYFLTIFGIWKILGAIVIIIPGFKRLKEWAYAGMIFDLTGAVYSRISSHDKMVMVLIPLFISCIVIVSWLLRPVNRKL